MSDDLKQVYAKLQSYIKEVAEKAKAENAKPAPNPILVLIGFWVTSVERLIDLRAGQISTVVFIAACIALIFYALFNTDQGRDLLQLAQDQHSVTTLFIGLSAITSFGTSLALKAILTNRPIGDFLAWGAMPAFGIGLFAGFFYHSFLTFILTWLLGGIGFALFFVLEASTKRSPKWTARFCCGVSVVIFALISFFPGVLGHRLGSPLILIISVFAWVLLFYSFAAIGFLSGNPGNGFKTAVKWGAGIWIVKCLLVAFFVAALDYPILDYIRFDRTKKVTSVPTLKQALDSWTANQEQKAGTKPKLVLVAAAGGGIRASYWTALSLARLLDQAPDFRKSLFASSGVSGGSLGLSVFYGLLANSKLDCRGSGEKIEPCVNVFHDNDFLAGPLGAIFAGYATNSFLPIFPSRDDALEQSWERAWRTTVGTPIGSADTFSSPMSELWGKSTGHPLLLLNATLGSTGERVISADVDVNAEGVLNWKAACKLNLATLIPLQLSAAIGASARFPFVSEWGWVKPTNRDQCNPFEAVADGGFFDNYGATTILDLIEALIATDSQIFNNYEVVVIQITNDPSREMGCIFKKLDKDKPAPSDYCAPLPQGKTGSSAWSSFTRAFVKMNPILQLTNPGFPKTMERLPAGLWAAFFGTSGPGVVDVTMQALTVTGIDVAEKLRNRVCGLGGSYYHLSTTGAGEVPLGWTLSKSAQARLSSLLSDGHPKQRFDRLVGKLKGDNQTSQCVAN